jgi:hypothetical protein
MKPFVRLFLFLALVLALTGFGSAFPQAWAAASNLNPPQASMSSEAFSEAGLPVMPGLELRQKDDAILLFGAPDKPPLEAEGLVDVDEVYYYYERRLPSLGWQKASPRLYFKDGVTLRVDARSSGGDGRTIVRFEMTR